MEGRQAKLLNATEVAEWLGVCRTTAYAVIKELNREMEARGCRTISGRVSSELLEQAYLRPKQGW